MRHVVIITILCLGMLFRPAVAADSAEPSTRWLSDTVTALTPQIESLAARTRPADWALLRSCLYYALAGQYLLARQGVATRLESGAVMYDPSTPRRHGIHPHVWLVSRTHFIDCATLPRWGVVTVIPLSLVARHPVDVIPGVTRVLIVGRRSDPEYLDYLDDHRARFADALRRQGLTVTK
jgi:hypothetical protein